MDDYFGSDDDMPDYWREPVAEGWDKDLDNDIAKAAGLNTGFVNEGQVPSFSLLHTTQSLKKSFSACNVTVEDLLRIPLIENKVFEHGAECEKCKKGKRPKSSPTETVWIMDSGASKHFTNELSDFAEYTPLKNGPRLSTAAKKAPLQVKGEGTVFLTHEITKSNGMKCRVITHFYPVFYVPGMSLRLMSMGELLVNGHTVIGDAISMKFFQKNSCIPALCVEPHFARPNHFLVAHESYFC